MARRSTAPQPPRPAAGPMTGVALLALACALAGLAARATYGARTTADEPQYLLTALSLADDRDLDISNQIANGDHLPFHEIPIDRQTFPLDESGREVSPHDPLLPVILAPAMGLGGWVLAKVVLAVVAAAVAVGTLRLAGRERLSAPLDNGGHTASRWGPAVVVGAGFAGIPLAAYGTQVYPEIVAAGCVVTALLGLRSLTDQGRSGRPAAVIVVVAAVVALPWLAIKYTPVAAVVAVALLLGLAGHPRVADRVEPNRRKTVIAAATVTVTLTVAGVVYLVAHRWIYGGWTAYASGDHFVDSGEFAVIGNEFSLLGRSRRLIGLLIDNTFGIAVWQPLWFLLVPAVVDGVRRRRWLLLALLGTGWLTATYVALTMHGWWVPGRQLVVVLPAALVLIAVWADRPGRIVATALLGLAGLVNWLWLALETTTGRRTLVVDFDQTAAIPYRLVGGITPDGMRAAPGDDLALVVWAVVLIATALLIRGRTVGSQDGDSDTEPTPTLPDPRRNELPTP